jgi:protease-4
LNDNEFFSRPDENGVRYYQAQGAGGVEVNRRGKSHSLRNSLIVLVLIIAVIAFIGVSCNSVLTLGETEVKLPNKDYIATIFVEGVIARGNYDSWGNPYGYQHSFTLKEIDRLKGDPNNRGLVIFVDSPGGGVYESDELYLKIKEYREWTGNPVYAAMASMAASGGYYVSAPADKIFANRNCWTGSIGVTIGTLIDISGFLDNYGIKTTTIASGSNKSIGSYFDPLTKEQREILQAIVDEAFDQFADIVEEERGLTRGAENEIADGRIYTARQAKELGLIDEVGTYKDAIDDMKLEYFLSDCDVVEIRYTYRSWLSYLLGGINLGRSSAGGDAAALLSLLEKQSKFPVSYLCEALVEH